MQASPLSEKVQVEIGSFGLEKKFAKALKLFVLNHRHPSLHTELLEPRHRGIYSFRIDRKFRALFFLTANGAEIFKITNHYKK